MFFLQNCIPTYVLIQNLVLDSSSLEFFIKIAYILIYLHTKLKLKNQKSKPVSQREKQRPNSDTLRKEPKIEVSIATGEENPSNTLHKEPKIEANNATGEAKGKLRPTS